MIAISSLVALAGLVAVEPIKPGAAAPAWKNLPGVDGKNHSLDDLDGAKVVVVVFTCNTCPFSVDYEDRINSFTSKYADRGVKVVAINVNTEEGDRLADMKKRAKEKGFVFPYLHDESQKIGKAYGARVTPHCFVLDSERKVVYVGAFDDARKPDRVTREYLKTAVEATLQGKRPPTVQTKAAGCSIKYE